MRQIYKNYTIIILFFIITITQQSQLPHCQTGFFYNTLPLTADQSYIVSLDELFGGYNLDYSINADSSIKKYITLGNKMNRQNYSFPDQPMSGLKSYHMEKKGNSWGQRFIAMTEQNDKTVVHFGILSINESVPVINNFITVQNYTNTTCFDAILFPIQNYIIVDCVQKRTSNNTKGQIYNNIFYYFLINNGSKVKTVKTQMYVPFQVIKSRQLHIYNSLDSSHTFLLRSYLAHGMEVETRDNTYTQVLMIDDPLDPWIVGIIDRSFLKVAKLRIMEVKVYLSHIYILDSTKGIHRVQITNSEDLLFIGTYEIKGFTKFGLFSPNLDDHMYLALANQHAVQQIDWTYIDEPRLLNKYSLMMNSKVNQVFLNQRFVFVQSTSEDNKKVYNYTWILNRGDRTFTRAFKVIKHGTSNTFIDINQELTYMLIFDQGSIVNYNFDQANMVIKLDNNEDLLDSINNFTVTASSWDPNSLDQNISCSFILNFTLLHEYNRTMWPIGIAPPNFYNANYPGKIMIELSEYVIGPNVTYKIKQTQKDQIKDAKVYQQEQLNVTWLKPPPFQNITFLQTQTIHGQERDQLVIYMQDNSNMTYISYCNPDHEELHVLCNKTETKDVGGKVNNWATALVTSPYTRQVFHILAYTTLQFYNTIFLQDLGNKKQLIQIVIGKSFVGNISSLTITDTHMFAVLRHIKQINVYLLQQCVTNIERCNSVCKINYLQLYKIGLKYFAPIAVHSSRFHPDILFVKTSDSIIVLDISVTCQAKILNVFNPVSNSLTDFIFEVNANFLVVTIAPNLVLEYDLSRIKLKQITLTKHYPLYGYKLPKNYDFDISDYGNCVYLSTINQGGDYNVFVYRSGYPAVGSLYSQINLFVYQNLLIDASGFIVDYVTVISGKNLRIFRQYEMPEAEIQNPNQDYNFYLQYFNSMDDAELQLINVKIINLPTYIKVNPFIQNIMNTKDLLHSGENAINIIDDTNWYEGNVLYIKPSCRDCGTKITISNHIEGEGIISVAPGLTDFSYNSRGGSAQLVDGLVTFRLNGTLGQVITFPEIIKKNCQKIAMSMKQTFEISGCNGDKAVYLYITSFVGEKGFSFEPFQTNAINLFKLQAVNNLIMLIDTQPDPYNKKTRGGIFLYQISDDQQQDQVLTQLQYIDGQDFGMKELGNIYINNAELTYSSATKTYRLYITQMTKGVFVIEFKHEPGKSDIIIIQIVYVDLKTMLAQMKQTLPYDATFQAITLMKSSTNSQSITTDSLLVTTGRFHTIQLSLQYSTTSLLKKQITKFYIRYSYYDVDNHIAHINQLFLIKHSLPDRYKDKNQTQQLYTIYSTKGQFNGKVEERGLIGAYQLSDNLQHSFDFNLSTYNPNSPLQTRIQMIIVQNSKSDLLKASLHRNLTLHTTQTLDTQIIYIDLINDFNIEKIRILLNGFAPFPQWKLITIILFSIIGFLILVGSTLFGIKKWRQAKITMGQERDTLLTQQTYN